MQANFDNFESGQQQLVQTRVMTTVFFGSFFSSSGLRILFETHKMMGDRVSISGLFISSI